ncbi:unnamed protein product [Linum trigynum]|uniref:Uncharacterized protein n=1 Tax=Linum trigynum TaxID=586398 RepID=A0AAV2F999_9ROSI
MMCLNILNSVLAIDHKYGITDIPYAILVNTFLKKVGVVLVAYPSSNSLSVYHHVAAIVEDLRDPVRAYQQRYLIDDMLKRMLQNRDREDRDGQRDMGADDDDDDDDDDEYDEDDDLVDDVDSGFRARRQVQ